VIFVNVFSFSVLT